MLESKCDLKMYVTNQGYPLPKYRGPQSHPFRRLRNLTATLTAYIVGKKHSAFYLIARRRRRRPANRTQPNFVKRWIVNRANNLPRKSKGLP